MGRMILLCQRKPEMNGMQFLIRISLTGQSDLQAVIQAVARGEIHPYVARLWNGEDQVLLVREALEQSLRTD